MNAKLYIISESEFHNSNRQVSACSCSYILSSTALSLIVNRKNEILNCTEYKYYFYHRNLGHIKLGYYEGLG